jgi:hypothetical protein
VSKVLVVDDEPEIVQFVTSALQDEGFEVVSAANGRQAVDAAARDRPDLVVLDMMLPRLDGQQVAQEIRRLHGDIPIGRRSGPRQGAARGSLRFSFEAIRRGRPPEVSPAPPSRVARAQLFACVPKCGPSGSDGQVNEISASIGAPRPCATPGSLAQPRVA